MEQVSKTTIDVNIGNGEIEGDLAAGFYRPAMRVVHRSKPFSARHGVEEGLDDGGQILAATAVVVSIAELGTELLRDNDGSGGYAFFLRTVYFLFCF